MCCPRPFSALLPLYTVAEFASGGQFIILYTSRHASPLLRDGNTLPQATGGHVALTGLTEEAYGRAGLEQRSFYQMYVLRNRSFFGSSVRISHSLHMLTDKKVRPH